MKGASDLIASVLLVLVAVASSVFISGWLSTTTEKETNIVKNTTQEQLRCQFADVYIRNATYNCAGSCANGTMHNLTVTVTNSGKRALSFASIFITNTTGSVTQLALNESTTFLVGDTLPLINRSDGSCSGINNSIDYIRVASTNCPNAYDSIEGSSVVYLNC